tara:strand:+ start:270 stop:668 length:399 start_codon:yes stop_codon:yes gene_type:complete
MKKNHSDLIIPKHLEGTISGMQLRFSLLKKDLKNKRKTRKQMICKNKIKQIVESKTNYGVGEVKLSRKDLQKQLLPLLPYPRVEFETKYSDDKYTVVVNVRLDDDSEEHYCTLGFSNKKQVYDFFKGLEIES